MINFVWFLGYPGVTNLARGPCIFKVPLHDAGGIVITISFHSDGGSFSLVVHGGGIWYVFLGCCWLHYKLIQGVSSIFVGFMLVTPVS